MKKILLKLILLVCIFLPNVKVFADDQYYDLDKISGIKDTTIITHIEINSLDNIDKIKEFINVKELLIKNLDITDISFVNDLKKLEKISVYYSSIDLLKFNNKNVKVVELISSYINRHDLSPLKNSSIEVLDLEGSYIKNIDTVKVLTTLKELSISSISNLKSLKPVTYLYNLEKLNFGGSEDLVTDEVLEFMRKNEIVGSLYDETDYLNLDGEKYTKELDDIIASLNLDGKTNKDKIKIITLYVADTLSYDYGCENKNGCANPEISFNRVAKSLTKKGVCYHYALLLNKLLNKVGIDSYLVTGYNEKRVGHAWVNIYLEDKWYAIDPTWLDFDGRSKTLRNTGKAQYYMVELKDGILFYKDHIADVEPRDIVDVLDIETEIEDKVDLFDEYQLIFIIFVTVLCVSIIVYSRKIVKTAKHKKKGNLDG